MTFIRSQVRRILLSALLTLLFMGVIAGGRLAAYTARDDGRGDMLAYSFTNRNGQFLRLYDQQRSVSTPLLGSGEGLSFRFGTDGRIAYSKWDDGFSLLYVLDILSPSSLPINISQNPTAHNYPLSWSADGRYLAFGVQGENENHLIYVWDGETAVNITPEDLENAVNYYRVSWSLDGRLAFTVYYLPSAPDQRNYSEIYLWDGNTTVNLSQNPNGEDGEPVWSTDGRLAFLSRRDDEVDILVWNGVSLKNGAPNTSVFTNVAPELTSYISYPTWTTSGDLAFGASSPPDNGIVQIYLWDGQRATNISQNPTLHNGSPRWGVDGRWAFVSFFSSQQLLYVRDADNRPLLTIEGQYPPAWSPNGYLMFCRRDASGWVLNVWDGQRVTEIAHSNYITAQWQGGDGVVCTSG